jgi:hypothetical protein
MGHQLDMVLKHLVLLMCYVISYSEVVLKLKFTGVKSSIWLKMSLC